MSVYNNKRNYDDVLLRSVLISVIYLLYNNIYIKNIKDDGIEDIVNIPFFPGGGGDERYMQDIFIGWDDCESIGLKEGNYDKIPRGSLWITDASIITEDLTNKFSEIRFNKNVNGELHSYYGKMNDVPIRLGISANVITDNFLEAAKIFDMLIKLFYRAHIIYFSYDNLSVPVEVGFPDNYQLTKLVEFTYPAEEKYVQLNFELEIRTHIPIIDSTTEIFSGNRIETIESSINPDISGDGDIEILGN